MQKIDSPEQLKAVLEAHAKKLARLIPKCTNEAQTKTTLIDPYLEYLGWDVRDPDIVRLEHKADFEIKKSEKVDYAILKDGKPLILIEAKAATTPLPKEAPAQLRRYFQAEISTYAVLTNGIVYQWYQQDPDGNPGKLALEPFLVDDATKVTDQDVDWLWHLNLDRFDKIILNLKAWQNDFQVQIQEWIQRNIEEPEEDLIRLLLEKYDIKRPISRSCIKDARAPIKQALNQNLANRQQATHIIPEPKKKQIKTPPPQKETSHKKKSRRQPSRFSTLEIPPGSILEFYRDNTITCKVLDDKKVEFDGREYPISTLASEILATRFNRKKIGTNGYAYFKFEGELLTKRRKRMEST